MLLSFKERHGKEGKGRESGRYPSIEVILSWEMKKDGDGVVSDEM